MREPAFGVVDCGPPVRLDFQTRPDGRFLDAPTATARDALAALLDVPKVRLHAQQPPSFVLHHDGRALIDFDQSARRVSKLR